MPVATMRVVAAAVALAALSSLHLAVVGPAVPVTLAGGCDLAVARVAALARSLAVAWLPAIGVLLGVALVCAAGTVNAALAESCRCSTE